ncbi:hypothetical protein vseg_011703 [Gypsophila vaccaria]
MVKTVLTSLHSYWDSLFILPKGIIARIKAICRNFLWDSSADYRKAPLVGWNSVCRSKEEGGLGIKCQEIRNQAMVGRLVNWVAERRDSIWVKWVQANYIKGEDWMTYTPSPNSSWVWRRICSVKERLAPSFSTGHWSASPAGYTPAGAYDWMRGRV